MFMLIKLGHAVREALHKALGTTGSLAVCVAGLSWVALAQQPMRLDQRSTMAISFPEDSPLGVVSADWGNSNATNRGGAMLLDLHSSLVLRNIDSRRIRAVTLQVLAQEVTPGGKASVSIPSLDVGPGEVFPIRLDMRLLRPMQVSNGPLVQVFLDGVLFSDLSFTGPDRLQSKRSMMLWETEARRDRQHFRAVYQTMGELGLQDQLVATVRRQDAQARMDAQVARGGRATALAGEREIRLAFLDVPESPVEPTEGFVRVAGGEARQPQIALRNRGTREVRAVQLGWMVKGEDGREYLGGAMPAELHLTAYQRGNIVPPSTLRFSQRSGQAIGISSLTAFVQNVEFQDGSFWVPSRRALENPQVARALPLSPEEQRMAELYRKRGLQAVVEELRKFQ